MFLLIYTLSSLSLPPPPSPLLFHVISKGINLMHWHFYNVHVSKSCLNIKLLLFSRTNENGKVNFGFMSRVSFANTAFMKNVRVYLVEWYLFLSLLFYFILCFPSATSSVYQSIYTYMMLNAKGILTSDVPMAYFLKFKPITYCMKTIALKSSIHRELFEIQ